MKFNTPILFLTYKRYDTAKKVFESIKNIRPSKLYFVSNAPKNEDVIEIGKVLNVRSLVSLINWDCEVITLFRDVHLEVKESITFSIDWFFSFEDRGIILEDDCVASESFYFFCQELLEYYKNDTKIFSIGGCCFFENQSTLEDEYCFSNHTYIWGWATWKRAWLKYDVKMMKWPEFKKSKNFKTLFSNFMIRFYWINILNKVYNNQIKTWDYQWVYTVWLNNGLSILPNRNLVRNIGFGIDSNFTHDKKSIESNMNVSDIKFPLRHNNKILLNSIERKFVERYIYKITISSFARTVFYNTFSYLRKKIKK